MAINKEFTVAKKEVLWGEAVACTVRGLNPSDIIKLIAENPIDADKVLEALSEQAESEIAQAADGEVNVDALAAKLGAGSMQSAGKFAMQVPDLVAKLIATAADEPESWQHVRDKFVLPLQFEILTEVARLTFIDPPAFRRFLGNVMALVGVVGKADQRQKKVSR